MPDLALRGLSPELHKSLKRAAQRNHRSLNGEILARLEASLAPNTIDVEALLVRIADRQRGQRLPELSSPELKALKDPGRP